MVVWMIAWATAATSPTPGAKATVIATPVVVTPAVKLDATRPLPSLKPLQFRRRTLETAPRLPSTRANAVEPMDTTPTVQAERENVFVLDNNDFPGLHTGLEERGQLCISEQ